MNEHWCVEEKKKKGFKRSLAHCIYWTFDENISREADTVQKKKDLFLSTVFGGWGRKMIFKYLG